jgi:pectate lyase
MTRFVWPILLLSATISLAHAQVPAFPGAEGAGKYTTGGRGGAVIEVTSLADSGTGTLRAACLASGARTVVFRIGGIVTLTSNITITNPNITIAGQTAPGDGICVRGAEVGINTSNVIIRYMRFRRGDAATAGDCLGGYPISDIMVDHVSASWGLDESLSLYRYIDGAGVKTPTQNITIQWCIISETLNKNGHGFGGTWGGDRASFHHNLFACCTDRNASIGMTGEYWDWRNNVVFNWVNRNLEGGDASSKINVINNYYKHGAATPAGLENSVCMINWRGLSYQYPGPERFYLSGNYVYVYPDVTADNWNGGAALKFQGKGFPDPLPTLDTVIGISRVHAAFPATYVTTYDALTAFDMVTAGAGATLPVRDAVDQRVVTSVITGVTPYGTNGIINVESDAGGYPTYVSATPPTDSDHDGMPDWWEQLHGLNPGSASDRNGDYNGDGYTNLEKYLNSIVSGAYTPDTKAPYPNPMTWDSEPCVVSGGMVTLKATVAADYSGVEYYFASVTDPNHNSGWQTSPLYTDSGLTNNAAYAYKVKARDTTNHNETGWSLTAFTPEYSCTAFVDGDLDRSCQVDAMDYSFLSGDYRGNALTLYSGYISPITQIPTLAQVAAEWLACNREPSSECW